MRTPGEAAVDEQAAEAPAAADARCPGCGKSFGCGAASGACWCMQLAPRLPVPGESGARCLCPECLARRLGVDADP